jgi:NAD(P)-dependent dehydrogenase (short-subunit alcohol dehydrogenase family)
MAKIEPKNYQVPGDLLKNRVILVTGAGDGIGRQAALSFAESGATVILLGRTTAKLERLYDDITAHGYPEPVIFPLCLEKATESDYQHMVDAIDQQFGKLDGLLHNAGLLGERTSIGNYPPETWRRVMQVNVNAPFLLTRAALPLLNIAAEASLLFTTSGVGRRGRAFMGAYSVSKFAIEGLAQIVADELEEISEVRANCINPGATRTSMRATAYPAENPEKLKTPEQIMPAYLYLMGPDSKGISGQSFDAQ